jgi:hypothetical protein
MYGLRREESDPRMDLLPTLAGKQLAAKNAVTHIDHMDVTIPGPWGKITRIRRHD